MDITNWSRENLMWLAGYVEGEGAFCVIHCKDRTYEYPSTSITVYSTDKDVIEKCLTISGCGTIGGPYIRKTNLKPMYGWGVRKQHDVYALCCALFQFMGSRRKEKIKELITTFKNKRLLAPLYLAFNEQNSINVWAKDKRCKVSCRTLKSRINNYKWPIEAAITTPLIPHNLYWKGHDNLRGALE